MAESQHGFKVKKQYKTYNKGTAFNYEAFKNKIDFENYGKEINKMIDLYDKQHGLEYHLKKFAKEFGDMADE